MAHRSKDGYEGKDMVTGGMAPSKAGSRPSSGGGRPSSAGKALPQQKQKPAPQQQQQQDGAPPLAAEASSKLRTAAAGGKGAAGGKKAAAVPPPPAGAPRAGRAAGGKAAAASAGASPTKVSASSKGAGSPPRPSGSPKGGSGGSPKSGKDKAKKSSKGEEGAGAASGEEDGRPRSADLEDDEEDDGAVASVDKAARQARKIFKLLDLDGDGKLTLQEVRKALKKNKKLIKYCEKTAPLRPLLVPRMFNATIKAMDTNEDGAVSFDEFFRFTRAVGRRQLADDQAKALYERIGSKRAALSAQQLPYALYTETAALAFLLECEKQEAEAQASLADPRVESVVGDFPIAAALRPVSVHAGAAKYVEQNERLRPDSVLEEVDFLTIMHFCIEHWGRQPRAPPAHDAVLGTAEAFSEMAVDFQRAGDFARAAFYAEQAVMLRPFDKVYRLAWADHLARNGELQAALRQAETSLQVAPKFWRAAWEMVQDLKARVEADLAAKTAKAAEAAASQSKEQGEPARGAETEEDEEEEGEEEDVEQDDDEQD
jgi:hypothetical protein